MSTQRKTNQLPRLNSAALGGTGNIPQQVENGTPGTAGLDMNFTPLLPSQLLMGSPFQAGSPQFQSPQFGNFQFNQGLQHGNPMAQMNQQMNQMNAMNQMNQMGQAGMQNALSPTSPGGFMSPIQGIPGGFFGDNFQALQSPTGMGGRNFTMAEMLQSPTGTRGSFSLGSPTSMSMPGPMQNQSTSRTVYLGNIPPETSAEEILSHVRSGQIESVRLLADKNCAFISFLDGSSATHFHSDAILKKLNIKGSDIKIGWGKPSQVPTATALAVQQSGASRNVYLGNLPEEITEEELKEDLTKFGPIDTIKLVREKNIGFVHFLSIGNAIKAVAQLPQEPKWGAPRRVYYGKDRCAYVSKTQQQNAAQYLGIPAGYANVLNGADREIISNALAQQSVAAAAVATSAGGVSNLGNRTVYLGNIHPETTIEEICNVVRGGLLHHIRYIPDKHICFVTFIDPTAAASFYALSNLQGLMIHNRRLKIGWGKHSGALPPAIAMAVSGGASRNVYVGNLDESWTEERLRQDFSEYGEIELVNTLREKSCAFVNFTNIANAIKAIEGMRGKDEYKRFKINFGKDRCGNPPRQNSVVQGQQNGQPGQMADIHRQSMSQSPGDSNESPVRSDSISPGPVPQVGNVAQPQPLGPAASAVLNAGGANPLTMYLNQVQAGTLQADSPVSAEHGGRSYSIPTLPPLQESQAVGPSGLHNIATSSTNELLNGSLAEPQSASASQAPANGLSSTVGGHLARERGEKGSSHSRTVSLPVFTHDPFSQGQERQSAVGSALPPPSHRREQSSFTGLGSAWGGFGVNSGLRLGLGKVEETTR